jgi:hypothetical protein
MIWRFILHQNTAPQSLYITANSQAAIHVSENACSLLGPQQDTYISDGKRQKIWARRPKSYVSVGLYTGLDICISKQLDKIQYRHRQMYISKCCASTWEDCMMNGT